MEKQKIIIDTDCGSDDAMAICMALNDERYEILLFSVVSGNVHASQAALNTLTSIEYAKTYEPPVYIGCGDMIIEKLSYAHETHGQDGMGDQGYSPKRLKIASGNGVVKMVQMLEAHAPSTIEIIALGTLTNIALAMRLFPESMRRVKRIVAMGTAGFGPGNVTPVAEFNIWQDPLAAKIVLEFGVDLMFVGWDACTGEAMLEAAELDRLQQSGELGKFAVKCNSQLESLNFERFNRRCLDMADPSAVAAALNPECIKSCAKYYCEVDVSGGPCHGAVIIDQYNYFKKEPNAYICSALYPEIYKNYIFKMLKADK